MEYFFIACCFCWSWSHHVDVCSITFNFGDGMLIKVLIAVNEIVCLLLIHLSPADYFRFFISDHYHTHLHWSVSCAVVWTSTFRPPPDLFSFCEPVAHLTDNLSTYHWVSFLATFLNWRFLLKDGHEYFLVWWILDLTFRNLKSVEFII